MKTKNVSKLIDIIEEQNAYIKELHTNQLMLYKTITTMTKMLSEKNESKK